ncbi:hypothetical protein evm_015617 [Chilo suppressalis]|nr:hypothetical protein evm_015617 [Chilo suppressalis]
MYSKEFLIMQPSYRAMYTIITEDLDKNRWVNIIKSTTDIKKIIIFRRLFASSTLESTNVIPNHTYRKISGLISLFIVVAYLPVA